MKQTWREALFKIVPALYLAGLWPANGQQPLYNKPPMQPRIAPGSAFNNPGIDLSGIQPATNLQSSRLSLNDRTGAAVFGAAKNRGIINSDGSWMGVAILAMWAYLDYFVDDASGSQANGIQYRLDASVFLPQAQPGYAGTTKGTPAQAEYDFLMHFYLPLVYRYYGDLADPAFGGSIALRDHIINDLLGGATRSGIPGGRRVAGRADAHEFEFVHVDSTVDVSETENHLLGINAARYLVNQLLFQRTCRRSTMTRTWCAPGCPIIGSQTRSWTYS